MSEAALRFDFITVLASYRRGDSTAADLVEWEAQYALDDSVSEDLSKDFERVALIASEVVDGIRSEEDLRQLVDSLIPPTTEVLKRRWAFDVARAAQSETVSASESFDVRAQLSPSLVP